MKARCVICEKVNLRWVTADVNDSKRNLLDEEFFNLCEMVLKYRGIPR